MYKIDKQQGHIVQQKDVCSLFCNNFKWNIIHKITELFCCISETNSVNQLYFQKKTGMTLLTIPFNLYLKLIANKKIKEK